MWQALAGLAGKFTDAAMRKLNYAVDGTHQPVNSFGSSAAATIATAWDLMPGSVFN